MASLKDLCQDIKALVGCLLIWKPVCRQCHAHLYMPPPLRIFMEQVGSFQLLLNKEEMRGEFWYCVLGGGLYIVKASFRFSGRHSDAKNGGWWTKVKYLRLHETVLLRSWRIVLFMIWQIWCSNIASFYWKPWLGTNFVWHLAPNTLFMISS